MKNIFKRKYTFQGMVQFDNNNRLVICGEYVKWLDVVTIEEYTYKRAIKKALSILYIKYPEYGEMIQLF